MSDARFWASFLGWHVRTAHPWDLALHMDAMSMEIDGLTRTLADALRPALDKAAAALREWGQRYAEAAA